MRPILSLILVAISTLTALNARADETNASAPTPPREAPPPIATSSAPKQADETLFGDRIEHGGYGAPEMKVTSVAHSPALLAGAQGGWIIGHRLVLGGAGYGLATDVTSPDVLQPANATAKLNLGYGGLRAAGIVAPRSIVHLELSMLVGGGSAGSATSSGGSHRSDTFWVLEPEVAMEANLARNVRLTTGFAYRIIGGTSVPGLNAANLSGPAGAIAVKFGVF